MHLSAQRKRQRGLTLVELMIAVTIALLLLAALGAMYGSSVKARNEIERTNRQIENGRYAIQLLRDDIQMAGFWGEYKIRDFASEDLAAPGSIPNALPDFCVTHKDAHPGDGLGPVDGAGEPVDITGDAVADGLDYLAASMPMHVQGIDDYVAAPLPTCLAGASLSVVPETDVIVVRRLLGCSLGEVDCPAAVAGAPYMQASLCDDELNQVPPLRFRLSDDLDDLDLTDRSCAAGNLAPRRRYVTHIYFISSFSVTASDGIPTLKRLELVGTDDGWRSQALVEGIEDLQLEYGRDTNGDGIADLYVNEPATAAEWADVMAVRVHLLSRSVDRARPGYVDNNTYVLGTKEIEPREDNYVRQVFQTLVQIRNPAGRRS
jgi:type IV pilus assembly protein PilW